MPHGNKQRPTDCQCAQLLAEVVIPQLNSIRRKLGAVIEGEIIMAVELESLRAEVARNTDVDASAVALLTGLSAKIQALIDGGSNPAELQAFADSLKGSSDSLAAAVVENTPVA